MFDGKSDWRLLIALTYGNTDFLYFKKSGSASSTEIESEYQKIIIQQ